MSASLQLSSDSVIASPQDAERRACPREQRLRAMVEHHYDFIGRLLRRMGVPPSDLEDASQQVFAVAAARVEQIVEGSERSFLFGTALRVASTARRVRGRERPDADVGSQSDPAPAADELLDRKRARELLDALLAGLDDDARAVFVLYELEGMLLAEIAALVGVPVRTAQSRLRRAREDFEALVKRHGAREATALRGAR